MLRKYSLIFSQLMIGVFDLEMYYYPEVSDPQSDESKLPIEDEDKSRMIELLERSIRLSKELELGSVSPLSERMKARATSGNYSRVDAGRDLSNLRSRIEDELRSRLFFFISPSRASYYVDAQQFGPAVESRFPHAIDDIESAAKCLALGQGTACVLHLMRVMEVGLKALAKPLGIPYAPSWEAYLRQIAAQIALPHKSKMARWKRNEVFYRDVSGDLISVKQAFRNPTMHVGRKFSAEEAENVFRTVRAFMQRLEAGLPKSKATKI